MKQTRYMMLLAMAWLMLGVPMVAQKSIEDYKTPVIVPVTLERTLPYTAFKGVLRVAANTDYDVAVNVDWLQVEKTGKGLRLQAEANTTPWLRIGQITLTSTDAADVKRTIQINQESQDLSNDADARARLALQMMSLDDKLNLIVGENSFYTKAISSIKLPRLFQSDGPQGVRTDKKSTAYPSNIVLAATWNRDMAYAYGQALGRDSRARGINFILGPGVNIYRSPRGGRNFEYMGEDPWLTSQIACGYIEGVQSNPGVVCMMKHFAANFMEYGRLSTSSDVDERTLQEIYLPAFRHAVQDANVGSIMSGYNLVNGVYCCEDSFLMQTVLRQQWHYPFMTVSDWGAPYYAKGSGWSPNHIVNLANHGVDLEAATPGYYQLKPDELKKYIAEGKVKEANIDEKVLNILRTIYYFHLDEYTTADNTIALDNAENGQVAYQTAAEGLVLLKNADNFLPFNPATVKKIGVMGTNADRYVYGGGSGEVYPFHSVTPLAGLQAVGEEKGVQVDLIDFSEVEPIANKNGRTFFYTDEACTTPGFTAKYYKNRNATGTAITTRVEQEINNSWETKKVTNLGSTDFSVTWTGYLKCDMTAKYTFAFTADDGMDLTLNGSKIIDDWVDNPEHTKTATVTLTAGQVYPIVARFYQAGGGAVARLEVTRDNKDYQAQQMALLGSYDAIVVCEGFDKDTEGENKDRTFALPTERQQMILNALKSNKPVIAVINSGGGIDMRAWVDKVSGIVWAGYPGQEGGTAIARVLFGDVNPSGRLPMTFERQESDGPSYNYYNASNRRVVFKEGIYMGYRAFEKNKKTPLFPFGFGLSYTTFELSDLKVTPASATVTVTNTGDRAGAEVVQIYVGPNSQAVIDRPAKELRGFTKVSLQPGESKTVEIAIDDHAYSFFNVATHAFQQVPGDYTVWAGTSSAALPLQATVTVGE